MKYEYIQEVLIHNALSIFCMNLIKRNSEAELKKESVEMKNEEGFVCF